jgi:predicted dehydrogenase
VVTVDADTHVASLIEFESGQIATMVASFDVAADQSTIEVQGTEGTVRLPDPRTYGGPVRIQTSGDPRWRVANAAHSANDVYGIGLIDMITSTREQRGHRVAGQYSYHVLEVTTAILDSIGEGRRITVESRCERPAPLLDELLVRT